MQALILAAGRGSRLGGLTADVPKPLVPVAGTPMIVSAIRRLFAAGITRIAIVVGYKAELLSRQVQEAFPALCLEFIESRDYQSTNNIVSLQLAQHFLCEDDTVVLESDIVFDNELLSALLSCPFSNVVAASPYQTWMDGGVITVTSDGLVDRFLNKSQFDPEHIESYYKTINIYRLSRTFSRQVFCDVINAFVKAFGVGEYYEAVFSLLCADRRAQLGALIVPVRHWIEIDDQVDLEQASVTFATEKAQKAMGERFGGYWRFPWVLDASLLVNPYFPPKRLMGELIATADELIRSYPSGQAEQRRLASLLTGVSPDLLLVGNGASELMAVLLPLFTGPTLVPVPTFEEYRQRLTRCPIIPFRTGRSGLERSLDQIVESAKQKQCKQVVLINPNNPTGELIGRKKVLELIAELRRFDATLILDESFVDFSDSPVDASLMDEQLIRAHDNLVIIKSISKSYGVPGIRLGVMATSQEELRSRASSALPIWNIGSFAEAFMHMFRKYRSDYTRSLVQLRAARSLMLRKLNEIPGVEVIPSQANFVLCRLPDEVDSDDVCRIAFNRFGILLKNCTGRYGLDRGNYLRIAIKTPDENTRIVSALRGTLERERQDLALVSH